MQVGVLGPLLIRVNDRDVTPRGQRARDVLVVLLQRRGRSVPAEVVLDLVWGEAAVGLNGSAVHTVVSRLRRQLGASTITSNGIGYLVDRTTVTDEDVFTELVGAARRHLEAGHARRSCDSYRKALTLWRGSEAFEGVRVDLVDADRARLAELRAAAAEELAGTLLDRPDLGQAQEALELATAVITAHPLRERAHQLAMLAAYRCQRQSLALSIFQDLRRRLRADLGIEPTKASTQLQSKVLRQDPTLDSRPSLPAETYQRAAGPPAAVTPLIGRAAELTGLLDALVVGRRLVTLVGPGGVGKSRLLIELGARRQEMKGVVYTAMSGLVEAGPDELAGAIALGHIDLDARRPPVESLMSALLDGNWLLLIDEAEWAIESLTPVLAGILDQCPGVQIVVTSRMPLDLVGELLIRIEPLEYPDLELSVPDGLREERDGAAILASPAVEFLVQRLRDRAVPVDAEPTTTALLAAIARRVDGLPLALELAAGQASGRSLAEIAVLVESLLDVPAINRNRDDRHRSLRSMLDWSVSRLTSEHRTVLRRLSVFVGRFDLSGAAAVCGSIADVEETVRSLAREALVHIERTGASLVIFRLLRAVRDLAREDLRDDELAAARALHRRWHAGLWRAGRVELVETVRANQDDYLEALRTALDSRDTSTLADLTLTMAEFWRYSSGQAVGFKWIARVLDSGVLTGRDQARVKVQRAALALHHTPEFVLPDTGEAIAVLTDEPDDPLLVLAHVVRGVELSARGHWQQAVDQLDAAVQLARSAAGWPMIRALSAQANVHALIGDAEGATDPIAEVRSLVGESTPPATRIVAYTNIGLAMLNLDRPADALLLLDVVRPDVQQVQGRRPPDFYLLCQGWAELGCGSAAAALRSFFASVPTHAPGVADRQSAESYLGVGCALADLGHPDAASTIAAATELADRVQLVLPPAMRRRVSTATQMFGSPASVAMAIVPTAGLLDRLQRTLVNAHEQLSITHPVIA